MRLIWKVVISLTTAAVLSIIIGVPLGLLLPRTKEFRANFMNKCEKFKEKDHKGRMSNSTCSLLQQGPVTFRDYCQCLLNVFEQAYVGKDQCEVPVEAYDPLIANVNLSHPCNQTTLWSGTAKPFVDTYITNNQGCFSLEKTLLGFVLDNKTWYGKVNCNETFTQLWPKCENNPRRSFWRKVSIHFASYACGEVTVMLNGGKTEPFDPSSTLALEIKNLSLKVTRLNVVLIKGDKSRCNSSNLQTLRTELKEKGIAFNCNNTSEKDIKKCKASPSRPCGACLFD